LKFVKCFQDLKNEIIDDLKKVKQEVDEKIESMKNEFNEERRKKKQKKKEKNNMVNMCMFEEKEVRDSEEGGRRVRVRKKKMK